MFNQRTSKNSFHKNMWSFPAPAACWSTCGTAFIDIKTTFKNTWNDCKQLHQCNLAGSLEILNGGKSTGRRTEPKSSLCSLLRKGCEGFVEGVECHSDSRINSFIWSTQLSERTFTNQKRFVFSVTGWLWWNGCNNGESTPAWCIWRKSSDRPGMGYILVSGFYKCST